MDNIEITVFDEINDYKEKIYFFNFRQWAFSILIAIIVIPTYLILKEKIGEEITSYIVIAIAAFLGFIGFVKIHELPAEKILPYWFRHYTLFAKPIKYIPDAEYELLHQKKHRKEGYTPEQFYRGDSVFLRSIRGMTEKMKEQILDPVWKEQTKKEWELCQKEEIRYYSYFFKDYPVYLRKIYQPPRELFARGPLPEDIKGSIAIVGARDCSFYGRDMARWFGARLARAGMWVVSGMALGIDGWAHRGALEAGGRTCAVLGSGIKVCYPERNRALYKQLWQQGSIVSEWPVYTKAQPGFFPLRNRIISGLASGVLVVEAREKSGSLITANEALDQGKDVFVVPGRIGDRLSQGCNRLICAGAIPVLCPEDILNYYGIEEKEIMRNFTKEEEKIWQELGSYPVSVQALCRTTGIHLERVYKILLKWKKNQWIQEVAQGYFIKE